MSKGRRWFIVGTSLVITAVAATGVNAAVSLKQAATPSTLTLDLPPIASIRTPTVEVPAVVPTLVPTLGANTGGTPPQAKANSRSAGVGAGDGAGAVTKPEAKAPASATKPDTPAGTAGKAGKATEKAKQSSTPRPITSGTKPGTGRIRLGTTYRGTATFYNATGTGNCSFDESSDLMIGAMNATDYADSQACGAFLEVTGPSGKKVKIQVVDQCPECAVGAIDLSEEAFATLAPTSKGKISITWKLLSPASSGLPSYRYKTGSSQFWCGIQVLNHRNPIRSLQVKVDGTWETLERQTYNYFESQNGSGCGSTIRVTDIYGGQITQTGISISPDKIQRGSLQFGAPV